MITDKRLRFDVLLTIFDSFQLFWINLTESSLIILPVMLRFYSTNNFIDLFQRIIYRRLLGFACYVWFLDEKHVVKCLWHVSSEP